MPLSEHVYCVATPFKMAEWLEQWICNKFCIKVEHYSRNYYYDSEGCSYEKLVIGSFIMTTHLLMHHVCAEFFGEAANHPGDSAPLQPRFGALWLLAFPKTKITFEREGISDYPWDSGKYNGAADGTWENCVRSQDVYSDGDWGAIVLSIMFIVSCDFFNKCLYFSYYMAGYLLDRSPTYTYIQGYTH